MDYGTRTAIIEALRERVSTIALGRGGLLGLAVLGLYAWLAPAHVVDGDNAEFASLGVLGGAAHPSGYPLYVLWLRATSWLPGATPARTAALATALLGAAAIVVLHAACRAWGARPLAATVACAVVATAPFVVTMFSEAEVFALNTLVVATVLWLAAGQGPVRGIARAGALGLVAGLGMSNHLTCVLVAPVGLLGVVRGVREARGRARAAAVGAAVLGVAVGLLPYAYLLAAPSTPLSWGAVHDLDGVAGMIARRDYGSAGTFLAHAGGATLGQDLGALARSLGRAWLWAPLALGLGTLAWRCVRAKPDAGRDLRPAGRSAEWRCGSIAETRVAWGTLAASWLLAGPVLASRFNTPAEGLGRYTIERFHILPAVLLAIPVAVGLGELAARLPARVRALARVASLIAPTLGLAALAGLSLPHVESAHGDAVERYARNTLHMLPPGSVAIVATDELYFGCGYLQAVLGERLDVTIVSWNLLALPWYRDRVQALGILPAREHGTPGARLAKGILDQHRPLFVDRSIGQIVRAFPTYPYGTLARVLPRDAPRPDVEQIFAINRAVYDGFALAPADAEGDAPWPTAVRGYYAEPWAILARALAQAGRADDAAWAADAARQVGPAR